MKYIWSKTDGNWSEQEFDTLEECIAAARSDLNSKVNISILIGRKECVDMQKIIRESEVVNVYALLDAFESFIQDDYDLDWEAYEFEKNKNEIEFIGSKIIDLLAEFFKTTDNLPLIRIISDVKEIIVKG